MGLSVREQLFAGASTAATLEAVASAAIEQNAENRAKIKALFEKTERHEQQNVELLQRHERIILVQKQTQRLIRRAFVLGIIIALLLVAVIALLCIRGFT